MPIDNSIQRVLDGRARSHVTHGDCLDVLRSIPAESVDSIITDPPYGIDYRTDRHKPIANDTAPFVWWLRDAYRVLRDGGGMLCFCRWDVQEAFRVAATWAGFRVRSQVVWDRVHHGMGDTKAMFSPRHDVLWFATKGRFAFPGKRPPSVIAASRPSGSAHPTEKPVDLMRQLVRAITPEGGLVLDPCAWSGATGVGAVLEERRFLGIELEEEYVALARGRLRELE